MRTLDKIPTEGPIAAAVAMGPYVANLLDSVTTHYAVQQYGMGVEANPTMRALLEQQGVTGMYFAKAVLPAVVTGALLAYRHCRYGDVMATHLDSANRPVRNIHLITTGIFTGLALWNASQIALSKLLEQYTI